jgi:hypothetical protein
VLTEEYGSESLSNTEYNDHRFDSVLQEWIHVPPKDTN